MDWYLMAGCFLGGVSLGIVWTVIMFKLDEKKRIQEAESFYEKSQRDLKKWRDKDE